MKEVIGGEGRRIKRIERSKWRIKLERRGIPRICQGHDEEV
jgi:hypothetical protein